MQETETDLAPTGEAFAELSLAQDLRQLADEAKVLAQTEFAFQKSRAAFVGSEAKAIAILLVVALVVVFFAVMALVVGTVIALGPLLGLWGAMAAVTLALVAIAAFCAFSAKARLARMMKIAGGGNET